MDNMVDRKDQAPDAADRERRGRKPAGERDPERLDKRPLIQKIATETGIDLPEATTLYETLIKTIVNHIRSGRSVYLTGFGEFYGQKHAGHKVRFGVDKKEDYSVLKFSATRKINEYLDMPEDAAKITRIPGTRLDGGENVGKGLIETKPRNKKTSKQEQTQG